ncbi:MAG: phytanoyl-CoA dioxygenase family protein [bacterium]|nr:hypothetical protein [Gammaproteobacteria bacterium]HIL95221.1 hypothetical protein [Pseudomonadales bacterium]
MRFTQNDVDQWREDGFCIIEKFFTKEEYQPVLADYEEIYKGVAQSADQASVRVLQEDDDFGLNRATQFKNIHSLPYNASVEMNLISFHPQLIAFARALLDTPHVHCYQSHTWAKFTGQADYNQDFHCDFGNHTLTVPSDDPVGRTVDFIFYLTDVTKEHGALRYVTKTNVRKALGRPALAAPTEEDQTALLEYEQAVTVPAGSLVAHSIDTMHRGANLTIPHGRRFSMTVGYKAAGNENIGFHVWQTGADKPWDLILNNGTPEQLSMLGIPEPGDSYWTERTLKLTQARWPEWDMAEYFTKSGI